MKIILYKIHIALIVLVSAIVGIETSLCFNVHIPTELHCLVTNNWALAFVKQKTNKTKTIVN